MRLQPVGQFLHIGCTAQKASRSTHHLPTQREKSGSSDGSSASCSSLPAPRRLLNQSASSSVASSTSSCGVESVHSPSSSYSCNAIFASKPSSDAAII